MMIAGALLTAYRQKVVSLSRKIEILEQNIS